MTENGQDHSSDDPHRPLTPPSFSLPEAMKDEYELWTIRLPAGVDVKSLEGMQIDLSHTDDTKAILGTFKQENTEYGLVSGQAAENESFRLLLADEEQSDDDSSSSSSDSSSESDHSKAKQKKVFMRPSEISFERHINVVDVASLRDRPETELAPRLEIAPEPADPIRRSYASIPQATGLKRRWMPPGVAALPKIPEPTIAPKKSRKAAGNDTTDTGDDRVTKLTGLKDSNTPAVLDPSSVVTSEDNASSESKRQEVDQILDTSAASANSEVKKKSKRERKAEKKARKERKKEKKRNEKEQKQDTS